MAEYRHKVKTKCKFCRSEFDSFGLKKVCSDCNNNMERYFKEIRAYLEEYPNASAADICDKLNIPPALIKFFLKEERLEIKNNGRNYFLRCEKCNESITSGRYCFQCEISVTRSDMATVLVHNSENEKMENEIARFQSRMHFRGK